MPEHVAIAPLRRYVVAHQRFAHKRAAGLTDVAQVIEQLQAVQLDSISAVERAHRLTIGSRVGHYGRDIENALLAQGLAFEYWAHEACLVSMRDYALLKRRMLELHDKHWWGRARGDRGLEAEVLAEIRRRGPLPSRSFQGANTPGEMWGWKPAKRALEDLFASGELAVARRDGFQRVYDVAENVIPREHLEAPTPTEDEYVREYAARAVEARGALTAAGVVEHCRLRGRQKIVAAQLDQLVREGRVRRVRVEDGGPDVFVPFDAELDADPKSAVLLCPFENILWDRKFSARLFDFEHLIEVYKPEEQRQFGYYVLPLLVRDRIVARVDLRRNRAAGELEVRAVHREPGQRPTKAFEAALARALHRVAACAGVEWRG